MKNEKLNPPPNPGKYRCLVVDPPWNQGKTGKRKVRPMQSTMLDYKTMSYDEIKKLPIANWSSENSYIWLWATNSKDKKTGTPILKMAFDLLNEWGFNYYTTITWDKKTGPCPFGPYQIVTEHILFGYKGKVKFPKECLGKTKNIMQETAKGHSVKPDIIYDHISKWFEGPRLDVFARQEREGFDGWGDEYEK